MAKRLLSIGECMLELSTGDAGQLRKGYAGDTFNAAFYARAALPADWQVDYLTAVGTDRVSDEMLAFMEASGVGTGFVERLPDRSPGLYMIHLENGERSFSYWRSASAARLLARDPGKLARALAAADIVIFSGITLAILESDGAEVLIEEIGKVRDTGRIVAFDPNIRPRLWPDPDRMRAVIENGARASNLVLPSFDDEAAHFGDADIPATLKRYRSLGVERIVVKNGAGAVSVAFDGKISEVPVVPVAEIVDTTSAGDSFNGSFLAHLAIHGDPVAAAGFAARVAAIVVGRHGALVRHDLRP
jgi:Sugar kinases, ribokinase family